MSSVLKLTKDINGVEEVRAFALFRSSILLGPIQVRHSMEARASFQMQTEECNVIEKFSSM